MSIHVAPIEMSELDDYGQLVATVPDATIHASIEWMAFTQEVLPQAKPIYFLARKEGRPVGAIPAYEASGPCGTIINSLPYFGSHGDLLIDPAQEREPIASALLGALDEHVRSIDAASVNIVTRLCRSDDRELLTVPWIRRTDERIGQVSRLPEMTTPEELCSEVLARCSQKTRNLVRKGLKSGFRIFRSDDEADWLALHRHHVEGMARIGGSHKPWSHLASLRRMFPTPHASQLYVAYIDGAFAGGLLLLLYRRWVEYFMPVAVEEHRNRQVISALIAKAMTDYAAEGFELWNWGGTWPSQLGVYHFKRGWGAEDSTYGYYGFARDGAFDGISSADLLKSYPLFYLFRFRP